MILLQVVLAIVAISVLPVLYELWAARRASAAEAGSGKLDGGTGGLAAHPP